jgi:hypothetical protein
MAGLCGPTGLEHCRSIVREAIVQLTTEELAALAHLIG